MTESTDQLVLAEDIVDELNDCGREDVTALDLLDALASTGLMLTRGTDASAAYRRAVKGNGA